MSDGLFEPPSVKAPRSFSYAQIDLPHQLSADILAWAGTIPRHALVGEGIEVEPHVTVRYGFTFDEPAIVYEHLQAYEFRGMRVRLGAMSMFPATRGRPSEVLKIEVHSNQLLDLNNVLKKLPNKQSHSYNPHVTVAYIKRGWANKLKSNTFDGRSFQVESIIFHNRPRERFEIALR